MDFTLLRNSFIIGSLSTSFGGLILLATPYSQFSQFLISAGIGSLAASNLAIENCTNIAGRKLAKKQNELVILQSEVGNYAQILTAKHEELTKKSEELAKVIKLYNEVMGDAHDLEAEAEELREELTANKKINLTSAIDTLNESLKEVTQQVNNLM